MGIVIFIVIVVALVILLFKWGDSSAKKTLASDRIFRRWKDEVHLHPDSKARIRRAAEEEFYCHDVIADGFAGKVIGVSGIDYRVSLGSCSCPDYNKRHKPCKHMYYFACHTGRARITKEGREYRIERIKN